MRYVYTTLVVIFTAVVLLFNLQNLQAVTVSFLVFSVTMPVGLIVMASYLLGMATGGVLISAVGHWVRGSRRPSAVSRNASSTEKDQPRQTRG